MATSPTWEKNKVLASHNADRYWLKSPHSQNTNFPKLVTDAKSLGTLVSTKRHPNHALAQQRMASARADLDRIHWITAPRKTKRLLVQSKAATKVTYDAAINLPPKHAANQLTTASMHSTWGTTFYMRARELVFVNTLPPPPP